MAVCAAVFCMFANCAFNSLFSRCMSVKSFRRVAVASSSFKISLLEKDCGTPSGTFAGGAGTGGGGGDGNEAMLPGDARSRNEGASCAFFDATRLSTCARFTEVVDCDAPSSSSSWLSAGKAAKLDPIFSAATTFGANTFVGASCDAISDFVGLGGGGFCCGGLRRAGSVGLFCDGFNSGSGSFFNLFNALEPVRGGGGSDGGGP